MSQWHLYHLIRPHDLLKASTIRRITATTASGAATSSRTKLTLQIRVKSYEYDPGVAQLHVSGRITNETADTKVGQYHTLDLELQRPFTLEKEVGGESTGWDSVAIRTLNAAVDVTGERRAEAIAVIMQEGVARICFIGQCQTLVKQKIKETIPKKRTGSSDREKVRSLRHDSASLSVTLVRFANVIRLKAMAKFYKTILDNLLRLLEPSNTSSSSTSSTSTNKEIKTKPLLLASPGFTATGFHKYLDEQSKSNPALRGLRNASIVAQSSSGHMHSLGEVLQSPTVQARLSDTRYARETRLMDDVYTHLRQETNKATYGHREVERAVEEGAVGPGGGILIISNQLFRSDDIRERKRWVALVDRVTEVEGGEVRILSSDHESGKRLDALGGVAALCTFPLPEFEDEEDGGGDSS